MPKESLSQPLFSGIKIKLFLANKEGLRFLILRRSLVFVDSESARIGSIPLQRWRHNVRPLEAWETSRGLSINDRGRIRIFAESEARSVQTRVANDAGLCAIPFGGSAALYRGLLILMGQRLGPK